MPGGRPSKYQEQFCEELIRHMRKGLSFESYAGMVGVSSQTVHNWAEAHPAFLEAKRIGEALSRNWWEARLAALAETNEGNATAVVFALKNKFPAEWRDRQQHEHMGDGGGPVIFQTIYESDKRGERGDK